MNEKIPPVKSSKTFSNDHPTVLFLFQFLKRKVAAVAFMVHASLFPGSSNFDLYLPVSFLFRQHINKSSHQHKQTLLITRRGDDFAIPECLQLKLRDHRIELVSEHSKQVMPFELLKGLCQVHFFHALQFYN